VSDISAYFRDFTNALLGIHVTDSSGVRVNLDEGAARAVAMIESLGSAARKAILVGNGGSAAIASHMQNDLCKVVGVRALVFNEAPLLTAISNDDGYESAFPGLVSLWADPDDLLIAISSSGRSENILRSTRAAVERKCQVITFSGFSSQNPLRATGDLNFYVSSDLYGNVEMAHSVLAHFLTDCAMKRALTDQETSQVK
jgi:D-sedoheptulose 7-phosphate isomerase